MGTRTNQGAAIHSITIQPRITQTVDYGSGTRPAVRSCCLKSFKLRPGGLASQVIQALSGLATSRFTLGSARRRVLTDPIVACLVMSVAWYGIQLLYSSLEIPKNPGSWSYSGIPGLHGRVWCGSFVSAAYNVWMGDTVGLCPEERVWLAL
ncbi:hypothetical protein FPQ18DRAFT_308067 [Pyronema domesticum]|nr:hypothetical protein FPQ18DRAFT_308067 [Pyronema domesticum]